MTILTCTSSKKEVEFAAVTTCVLDLFQVTQNNFRYIYQIRVGLSNYYEDKHVLKYRWNPRASYDTFGLTLYLLEEM